MRPRRFVYVWRVISVLAVELAVAAGLAVVGIRRGGLHEANRADHQMLILQLELADLALWSDASYCRHPSVAVFFSAHADHPGALEHFPAGSMVPATAPWHPGEQLKEAVEVP